MLIRYERRNIFGQIRYYIIDEDDDAKSALIVLTHRGTIDDRDITALKALGHRVVEVVRAGSKLVEVD